MVDWSVVAVWRAVVVVVVVVGACVGQELPSEVVKTVTELTDEPTAESITKDACAPPDSLTQMLVYQLLSDKLGAEGRSVGEPAPPVVQVSTSLSTSYTTSVVTMAPSTNFITATTTYTTTVTTLNTKIIPLIFRGSRITTSFVESTTEVIVATEHQTSSTVFTPTILQTLPVLISVTATSTRGLDGAYTLANVETGASTVVPQPIATTTFDLDSAGILPANIDMNNLDLNQYDLSGLSSVFNGNNDVVSALTALLKQVDNEPPNQISKQISTQQQQFRHQEEEIFVDHEQSPKFNVIKGFTLKDNPEPAPRRHKSGPRKDARKRTGGTASSATRFSKYHKQPKPENNDLTPAKSFNREAERFSATTSRGTFSKNNRRKQPSRRTGRRAPAIRFRNARALQSSEDPPMSVNIARNVNRKVARGKSLTNDFRESSVTRLTSRGRNDAVVEEFGRPDHPVETSVITRFVRGTARGEYVKTITTVTLDGAQPNNRFKRNAFPSAMNSTQALKLSKLLKKPENLIKTKDIVKVLKQGDKKQLKALLKSLQWWIQHYSEEILDEKLPQVPQLASSMSTNVVNSFSRPNSEDLCPQVITQTETLYKTIYMDTLKS